MAASPPTLELTPASELEFILSSSEPTSAAKLTLRHLGGNGCMAFKVGPRALRTILTSAPSDSLTLHVHDSFQVKTTQPRRYLVRPNQGVIKLGGSEEVQILLVEKDKQTLLQSFESIGQAALDHSKDKFLVQSCQVSSDFENEYAAACEKDPAMGYDKLSSMWATVTSNKSIVVANKKLSVRHVANQSGQGLPSALTAPKEPAKPLEAMDKEELFFEIKGLRQKYDELVAFSVNLTAERDMISNTLEQTKRELTREMGKSAAQRNASNTAVARLGNGAETSAAGSNILLLLLIGLAMFVLGVRLESGGYANVLKQLPVLGNLLGGVETEQMDEL